MLKRARKRRAEKSKCVCEWRPSVSSMGVGEKKRKKEWRCGVSIPVPLACEANALPSELHPLYMCGVKHLHKHTGTKWSRKS